MDTFEFQIQIHGQQAGSRQEVSPLTLSIRDLAELLVPLQDALTKMAPDADLGGLAPLALVGQVETASAALTVRIPCALEPAAATLTSAAATGDWTGVPAAAHDALRSLSKWLARRRWRMRFLPDGSHGIRAAEISPDFPVPERIAPSEAHELTTVHGVLLVVGGVDETKFGRLRLLDGRVIPLALDEATARQLAPLLFEEVCLQGLATWDTANMRIVRFQVERLADYRATGPREAFAALREVVGDVFDELDPLEYQRHVRQGGDG